MFTIQHADRRREVLHSDLLWILSGELSGRQLGAHLQAATPENDIRIKDAVVSTVGTIQALARVVHALEGKSLAEAKAAQKEAPATREPLPGSIDKISEFIINHHRIPCLKSRPTTLPRATWPSPVIMPIPCSDNSTQFTDVKS